jgi:hypothetical protein
MDYNAGLKCGPVVGRPLIHPRLLCFKRRSTASDALDSPRAKSDTTCIWMRAARKGWGIASFVVPNFSRSSPMTKATGATCSPTACQPTLLAAFIALLVCTDRPVLAAESPTLAVELVRAGQHAQPKLRGDSGVRTTTPLTPLAVSAPSSATPFERPAFCDAAAVAEALELQSRRQLVSSDPGAGSSGTAAMLAYYKCVLKTATA